MRGRAGGAEQPPPGPGIRRGPAALDLSDEQRTKIADLARAARDQAAPLRDELQFTRRTLHRELFADKRDDAKVSSLTTKIATLEKQLSGLRVKTAAAVADLLTPEQRQKARLLEPGRGRGGGPLARPRIRG
jgi:Spy/CpxP family protein refolding chaperone